MSHDPDSASGGPLAGRERIFWVVFGLAAVVRAAHLLAIRDAPFFPLYMGDAASYHLWALDLAAGNWIGDRSFYQAPLYPYFLGAVYTAIGNHPAVIRAVQSLMGAAACGLVALAALRLFGRRAAWTAGVLLALYAPAVFFDGIVQKASLAFFLTSLLLWLVARAAARERDGPGEGAAGAGPAPRWLWPATGAVLGLLVLTRENALVLAPVLVGWAWLRRPAGADDEGAGEEDGEGGPGAGLLRRLRPRGLGAAGLLVAGGLAVLGPVAVRNWAVSGELHLTTSQFGPNFYMGNNPRATGLPQPLRIGRDNPRFERRDAVELAERATGRELSPGEVSAYWTDRALDYVASRPLDWLGLMGRKLFLFWNDVEIGDTEDLYTHADHSPVLEALRHLFRFGVLAVLGLLGVWVTRRDARLWPFRLLPLVYLASVLLFFVFARYRHPVAPFLALFAGGAAARARAFLGRASRAESAACLAAAAALAVVSFWPAVPVEELTSNTRASVGAAVERRSGPAGALPHYRRALELDPGNPTAHYYLATALQRTGRLEEALSHYREALRLQPDRAQVHNNYGVALLAAGRREAAVRQFRRAVELDPGYPNARVNLGTLARMRGDLEGAARHYRRAVEAAPGSAEPRRLLGHVLLARGEVDEAFRHYRAVADEGARGRILEEVTPVVWRMAVDPDSSLRRPEAALAAARHLARLRAPADPVRLRVLAAAQAAVGRYDAAARTARRALDQLGEEGAAAPEEGAAAPEEGPETGDDGTAREGEGLPAADAAALRRELERYRRGEPAPPGGAGEG